MGVNIFRPDGGDAEIAIFRQAPDMRAKRIEYVRQYKGSRDQAPVRKALETLHETVRRSPEKNLMEPIPGVVAARAALPEICDAMRSAADFQIPE